jgi:hypothetical protein
MRSTIRERRSTPRETPALRSIERSTTKRIAPKGPAPALVALVALSLAADACRHRRLPSDELDVMNPLAPAEPSSGPLDASLAGEPEDAAQPDAQPPVTGRPAGRTEGLLFVADRPAGREPDPSLRFRTHTRIETLPRYSYAWEGPEVPRWMALADGPALLSTLDPAEDGWFALYRGPANAARPVADAAVAVGYTSLGRRLFRVDLAAAVAGPTLEVTDARLDAASIYFVRSCHGYAREDRGRCGYVVALDVASGRVRWTTPPLVARGFITVVGERYLVVGYSFTSEPSFVSVLRKSDGRVMTRLAVDVRGYLEAVDPSGPSRALRVVGSGTRTQTLHVRGLDTDAPQLSLDGPATGEAGAVLRMGMRDPPPSS